MPTRILIIDDEDLFREDLALVLTRKGFDCQTAETAEIGLEKAAAFNPEIVLSDIVMPGKSGIEIIDDLLRINPECVIIVMTAFGTLDTAIDAFRKGAVDYLLKPLVMEDVFNKVERVVERQQLLLEVRSLRRSIGLDLESLSLVGQSPAFQSVLNLITKVAPQKSTVLISGESGTGKEVVARAIHESSEQKNAPFLAINCSGFQENLLESELFGHVKGAFTGAVKDKSGFFEAAGEGTLFLDEISEMPLALQSKLLRALEQKEFYRVGGTKLLPIRARVIAATNKSLKEMVQSGDFREDLYYRIAVFEIPLPPLRERKTDISLLADYFIQRYNREMKAHYIGVTPEVLSALLQYSWPGNIRELRNVIERAMILCDGHLITPEGLPPQITAAGPETEGDPRNLKNAVHAFERSFISRILRECGGNKEQAAREMGINPSTLYRKMADLGISADGPSPKSS